MTVQELIDQLQKVADKSKQVIYGERFNVHRIEQVVADPSNDNVILCYESEPEWYHSDYKYE